MAGNRCPQLLLLLPGHGDLSVGQHARTPAGIDLADCPLGCLPSRR